MGYLLPGTVVSVLGSHVKVRLDDNREVRQYSAHFLCIGYSGRSA
jgi:calcineurin-like phosphoesterase